MWVQPYSASLISCFNRNKVAGRENILTALRGYSRVFLARRHVWVPNIPGAGFLSQFKAAMEGLPEGPFPIAPD